MNFSRLSFFGLLAAIKKTISCFLKYFWVGRVPVVSMAPNANAKS